MKKSIASAALIVIAAWTAPLFGQNADTQSADERLREELRRRQGGNAAPAAEPADTTSTNTERRGYYNYPRTTRNTNAPKAATTTTTTSTNKTVSEGPPAPGAASTNVSKTTTASTNKTATSTNTTTTTTTQTNVTPPTTSATIPSRTRTSPTVRTTNAAPANANPANANVNAAPPVPGTTTAAPKTAGAEEPSSGDPLDEIVKEDFLWKGIQLDAVFEIYENLTHKTVIRSPSLLAAPAQGYHLSVKAPIKTRELLQIIDTALTYSGIAMIPKGERMIMAVPSSAAVALPFQEAPQFIPAGTPLPEASQYVMHLVKLEHALPSDVKQVLAQFSKIPGGNGIVDINETSTLILRDYADNVNRMLELIKQLDVETPTAFEHEVIPIRYADVADIAQVIGGLTSSGGVTTGIGGNTSGGGTLGTGGGRRSGLSGARSTSGMRGSGGGYGGSPGMGGGRYGSGGGLGGQGYNPQAMGGASPLGTAGSAAGARGDLQNRLSNIARGIQGDYQILGETKIIPDSRLNALLVFATRQDMKMIKEIVSKLDTPLPQVLIEAIVLEVSIGNNFNVGVSTVQNPRKDGKVTYGGGINNGPSFLSGVTNLASTVGSSFTYYGKWGNDMEVALSALASDSKVNLLSRPRVQTSHNKPANIFVGETRPYISGTYSDYGGQIRNQYEPLRIGIELNVTPLINPGGLVTLDITADVNEIGESVPVDQTFSVPATIDRSANAFVSVNNGDTIILGGFVRNKKTKSKSGVPFLKDIPGLGYIFSQTKTEDQRVELIIMIRPTVLTTPEEAAITAGIEQSKLPGLRQAQREFEKESARQNKKAKPDADLREQLRKEGVIN